MSLVRGALGDFGVVFKVANSYWLSSNFQHFLTRLSYVCMISHREYAKGDGNSIPTSLSSRLFRPRLLYVRRFRMLIHAKDGMVRFQRTYRHSCSPTSIIHVHDSASRECEKL